MSNKERSQFAVIGLGRFGTALATKLVEMDKEVLAIDLNEEKVNNISDIVTHSITADATDENVLKAVGIKNFDAVVVCIGTNMQASILVTLICKQLGVNYIVAKAQSEKHKTVLEKIGADLVVFPEEYMGRRVASMIANPKLNDVLDLSDGFKLIDIKTPKKWEDMSLAEVDLRKNYDVSVIYIKRSDGTSILTPGGDSILHNGDSMILGGHSTSIDKIANKFSAE